MAESVPSTHEHDGAYMSPSSKTFSAEDYFRTQPPPSTLEADLAKVREFVSRHDAAGKRIVLVTVRIPAALE